MRDSMTLRGTGIPQGRSRLYLWRHTDVVEVQQLSAVCSLTPGTWLLLLAQRHMLSPAVEQLRG